MSTFYNDIKFGLRLLAKSPGYALTVILILGLGIGATTLMFGVVNTVLLKPLPYPENNPSLASYPPSRRNHYE